MYAGNSFSKIRTYMDAESVTVVPTSNARTSEYIYYEAQRRNNTLIEEPASFFEQRTQNIVDCPCKYKFAVLRVETEGINIPMWTGGDKILQFAMVYEPDNINITRDVDIPIGLPLFNTNVVVGYINYSFQLAFNDMVAAYDTIHGPGSWVANTNLAQEPFGLKYDPVSELFSFYSPLQNETGLPDAIELIFGEEMYLLFSGNYYDPVFANVPANLGLQLMMFVLGYADTNVVNLNTVDYIQNQAVFSTDEIWHDVKQIVLVSDTITARPTQIGKNTQDGIVSAQNIILDFDVIINNTVTAGPATRVGLTPINYRWTDLTGDTPLRTLSFALYARKRNQELIPLTLLPGRSFSVLVLFAKTITN